MAELLKVGSPVALEVDSADVDIPKLSPLAQLDLDHMDLLVDLADLEVVSEEDLMGDVAEADLEVSRIEVDMVVVVVVVEEVVLDTKGVEAFHPEVEGAMEEVIVVGMVDLTDTVHPLTLQLDQVVEEVEALAEATAEEGLVAPAPQIAMAHQHLLVGMIHVVVVAHMMTDPVDIVEAEDMETVMDQLVEVVAIWSR